MSTSGDGDPASGGLDGSTGAEGAPAGATRAGDGADRGSGPHGDHDDSGSPPGVAALEARRAAGGPGEAAGLVAALEGGSSEDDSDIGPVQDEDGEEEPPEVLEVEVDAHQFPMVGFRFVFLELVHSMLRRIHHNDHVLVRPRSGRVVVRPRAPSPTGSAMLPVPPAPGGPGEGPALKAQEPEEPEDPDEDASWETPEEGPAEEADDDISVWEMAEETSTPEGKEPAGVRGLGAQPAGPRLSGALAAEAVGVREPSTN
nr:cancer/testis antigen 47B-like [Vicugna pacos]